MWIPDANLSAEPLRAQRTNWLVHAVRLAARAATKWDAYYEGVNMDEVKRDWAEQVLIGANRTANATATPRTRMERRRRKKRLRS